MRFLAARIGADNTGHVLVSTETGELVRRRIHKQTYPMPTPGAPRTIQEAYWHLVNQGTWSIIHRYHAPEWLHEEMFSQAAWKFNKACKRAATVDAPGPYLMVAAMRGAIDAYREQRGRTEGKPQKDGTSPRNIKQAIQFPVDEEGNEQEFIDRWAEEEFRRVEDEDAVQDILRRLPNDRYREMVIRYAIGETLAEIGAAFGVTESRASQMMSKVKYLLSSKEVERCSVASPVSLLASWR